MSNTHSITYETIKTFHQEIATKHKSINGFHRFDIQEVNNALSTTIGLPALLLEAPSTELYSETKMVSNFNRRQISFLLMDHAGASDDFDKKEDVLTQMEGIALDIQSYLVKCAKDSAHFLFGKFDINSCRIEKAGPLFDNMHGWNVLYEIKAHEPMIFDPSKWDL
jgi:hypothetical protein